MLAYFQRVKAELLNRQAIGLIGSCVVMASTTAALGLTSADIPIIVEAGLATHIAASVIGAALFPRTKKPPQSNAPML